MATQGPRHHALQKCKASIASHRRCVHRLCGNGHRHAARLLVDTGAAEDLRKMRCVASQTPTASYQGRMANISGKTCDRNAERQQCASYSSSIQETQGIRSSSGHPRGTQGSRDSCTRVCPRGHRRQNDSSSNQKITQVPPPVIHYHLCCLLARQVESLRIRSEDIEPTTAEQPDLATIGAKPPEDQPADENPAAQLVDSTPPNNTKKQAKPTSFP